MLITEQSILAEHCVAITGGIACGKSTVSKHLVTAGWLVLDADKLVHQLYKTDNETIDGVRQIYPPAYVNGEISRPVLGGAILSDPTLKQTLERFVHARLRTFMFSQLPKPVPEIFFYEAALIFETGRASEFLEVWLADCHPQEQIRRLMARNHLNEEEAIRRISLQMEQSEKRRLADFVIATESENWPNSVDQRLKALMRLYNANDMEKK